MADVIGAEGQLEAAGGQATAPAAGETGVVDEDIEEPRQPLGDGIHHAADGVEVAEVDGHHSEGWGAGGGKLVQAPGAARDSERHARRSFAPWAPSARAVAAPMPLDAPVMTTMVSSRSAIAPPPSSVSCSNRGYSR